jgi:hypothetical protein
MSSYALHTALGTNLQHYSGGSRQQALADTFGYIGPSDSPGSLGDFRRMLMLMSRATHVIATVHGSMTIDSHETEEIPAIILASCPSSAT